ncbi:MAG: two-component system, chemotaxis family, sensor kinase CheA [Myxococcaceae bacterium]|nr:two-component system, chemotaxis family, sensor kinase CheA [Myxococcaceae bacterium]
MIDEILQEFLMESRESLDELDRELVELEKNPRDPARLASIFRTVHTIKGTAGFFQFVKLESVAHVGENLLSRLRDGVIVLESVRTTALLAMVDAIRVLLGQIEASEAEGPGEYGSLVELLSATCKDETLAEAGALLAAIRPGAASNATPSMPPAKVVESAGQSVPAAGAPSAPAERAPQPPTMAMSTAAAPAKATVDARVQAEPAHEPEPVQVDRAQADPRIRVDVRLLDRLMNLVGELVLARNQLLQHVTGSPEPALVSTCQRLNLITTELQEGVMKTRMQPIENVWNRFPRVVRDLAQLCGKQVRLEMEGGSTELDKTIIEAIGDPLTHLVRNSVDHGIELPQKRVQAGKSAEGTLRLRSYHEGGRVNIEIADDGHGIDSERVKARALERGLITAERARSLAPHEVYALLFLPGFSTAEKVTNISGRGVGLDVVKSNIERLGGSVDIDSQPGRGTTFRIRIPLTLAIIPALVVGAGGERFAIPQVSLVELVRIDGEQVGTVIERIHGVPVVRLRGSLLALVELGELLKLDCTDRPRDLNMIVLQADDRQFGLLVDHIFDTEEIVVKPLGRELKGLDTYAGATIMGDGRVALILDVAGLAERAGIGSAERRAAIESAAARDRQLVPESSEQMLLFRSGKSARMAIPLESVTRLEEFSRTRIERVGGEDVVQYRGSILRLIYLSDVFGEARNDDDMLQVLVHSTSERDIGFVVDAIEDVIQQERTSQRRAGRPGTLGSSVIQGRVTEIIDAHAVCGLVGG